VTNHYRVHRRLAVAPVIFRAISRLHLRPTSLPLLQPDEKPRMNWIKLSVATTLAATLIASPATAYADCGDPGQPDAVSWFDPFISRILGITERGVADQPRFECNVSGHSSCRAVSITSAATSGLVHQ
jgi:hypothetical protein